MGTTKEFLNLYTHSIYFPYVAMYNDLTSVDNAHLEQVIDDLHKQEIFWPVFWTYIHYVTLTRYNELNPQAMNALLDTFTAYIICNDCEQHFKELRREHPYTTDWFIKPQWAARYMNFLHNEVNKRLEKPVLEFDDRIYQLHTTLQSASEAEIVVS